MKDERTCKISLSEDLSAYLDCMLDGGSMRKLSRHLKRCEDCREMLNEMMELRASLKSFRKATPKVDDAFWQATFQRARLSELESPIHSDSSSNLKRFITKPTHFSFRRVLIAAIAATVILGSVLVPISISGHAPVLTPADAAESVDVDAIVNSHAQASLHTLQVSRSKTVMIESESNARQTGNTVDESVFDIDQTKTDSLPAIR